MPVSILEALQNANANLENVQRMGPIGMRLLPMAKSQLQNAVTLLEKGYPLEHLVEPILEQYESVDKAPDYKGFDLK